MSNEIIMTSEGMLRFKNDLEEHMKEVSKQAMSLQRLCNGSKVHLRDEHMNEIINSINANCDELMITSSNYKALIEFCDSQIEAIRRYEEA